MKKSTLFLLVLLSTYTMFSQASIKIYSDLNEETALFLVSVNDEKQDAFHTDEMIIENLLPGKYTLQVSFNSDTIADWSKTIELKKNEKLVYKVVKMKDFGKDVGKVGRGFGQMTGNTEENQAEDLVQYYKLEKVKEEELD
jgi:hypothetical protein